MSTSQSSELLSALELTALVRTLQGDVAQMRIDVRALEGLRDGITTGAATAIAHLVGEMHALSESMASLHETAAVQGETLARQGESLAMLVAVNESTADLQAYVRAEFEEDRKERAAAAARDQKAQRLRLAHDKQHRQWMLNGYRLGAGVALPMLVAILMLVLGNAFQRLSQLPTSLFLISTGAVLMSLVGFIIVFLVFFRPLDLDNVPAARSSGSGSDNESKKEKETTP